MALFKSGNPALRESTVAGFAPVRDEAGAMTLQGTVNRMALLLLVLGVAALYTWNLFNQTQDFGSIALLFWLGLGGAFVVGLVISFKKELSPYLSLPYAALEGLSLGGLSALLDASYPGIAFQAFVLTFAICAVLLAIYTTGWIRPSENFKLIVAAATGGIAFYYLISIGLGFFGIRAPFINDNSWLGIAFTLGVIVVAALNLVVDFDFVEQGVANRVPKYMEWYGAFGILVTLIWLYIELLRLLAKLRSRD
jgi:uncharacterized YccA/Bax inhibitor family protein